MGALQEQKAGDLVSGRYELQRVFAKGGMGSVWVARDRKLRRDVALKLLSENYAGDAAARQRFEREAMSVAKLSSPHIVQIYDYGIDQGTPFIVMELLVGEDLRRRLKAKKLLNLPDMYRIVAQVAAGLTEAHQAGVVHRDLKPANIFLAKTQTGEIAKLLDFGVAKPDAEALDEQAITGAGSVVGTPQYMSPEQIRGLPDIDHRADLFSLGVIIYRCLVGRLPFAGKTINDLTVNIATDAVPPPSSIADWLPPELDAFIVRALAKKPAGRFSNARELADAFGTLIPGSQPGLDAPSLSGALGISGSWAAVQASSSGIAPVPNAPPSVADPLSLSVSGIATNPGSLSGPTTMSNTAQAAILAAADAELALVQQKPSWGKRIGVVLAVLCVVGLCIGVASVLFSGGATAKTAPTASISAPVVEPIASVPPLPEPSTTTTTEPSAEPAPKTSNKKVRRPVPAAPPPPPPAQPPAVDAPKPPPEPFNPFKNRK